MEQDNKMSFLPVATALALLIALGVSIAATMRSHKAAEEYERAVEQLQQSEKPKGHCFTCAAHTNDFCSTCRRGACRNCWLSKNGWVNWRCESCPTAALDEIDKLIDAEAERMGKAMKALKERREELLKGLPKMREGFHQHDRTD